MIELRWYVPVNGNKVLQYRQKIDTNIYAGFNRPEGVAPNMQWSPWQDVPLVSERDPSYP